MTTRTTRPLAGFGWLKRGFNVGYGNPKALLGGAALLLLACLLPSLLTMPMQWGTLQPGTLQPGTPPDMTMFAVIMAVSAIAGLLLIPLYAGYLQVIDAAERGQPARARDIFKPYREGEALRLIGYGLAMVGLYIVMFAIVIAATGRGLMQWYMQVMTAQAQHQPPPASLPEGFGMAFTLFFVLCLFMGGVYAISLGQVALRRRSVLGAIGDGFAGTLKNLLPLMVFFVGFVVALLVLAIVIVLLAGLLTLLGKLVATWLVLVLVIPLYIIFMVMLFAVMFGVMYHLWRDVCGDDTTGLAAESINA